MRRLFALIPPLLALALARSSPGPIAPVPDIPIVIRATAVQLDSSDPARDRVGALRYLGGWSLRSDEPAFGGLSGAVMGHDEIITVSDSGAIVRIGITGGRPNGGGHLAPLPAGCGAAGYKRDRDAEALTANPDRTMFWISLERRNSICRLNGLRRTEAEAFPPSIARWPEPTGGEALLRMPDGRFLMWSESRQGPRGSYALLRFDRDPTRAGAVVERFGWHAPAGFRPVEATLLPDGRILVLHRNFTFTGWVRSALSLLEPEALAPGHVREGDIVTGREIARIEGSLIRDNYEALAVDREGDRTILWIISDDNFHFLQRTLLLKFAIEG